MVMWRSGNRTTPASPRETPPANGQVHNTYMAQAGTSSPGCTPGCRYPSRYPDDRFRPCRRAHCPHPPCQRARARKEWAILSSSFRERPPHYFVTLKFTDGRDTRDKELASYLCAFAQRIRNHHRSSRVKLEYSLHVEFHEDGRPHVHAMLIASEVWSDRRIKRALKKLWAKSCPKRSIAVYCKAVKDPAKLARYIPKYVTHRSPVLPPDNWNGRICRLVRRSSGFLAAPAKVLWRRWCKEKSKRR
jgi:hypothetical protein